MFVILFAFMFVTAYAAQELPSYIHVCGRNDPNYSQCIINNINDIKNIVCTSGMPEFNISPIEPLIFEKIIIYDTDNLKLSLQDSKITEACNFVVKFVHITPDKLHFDFDILFKHFNMDSIYDFDIRLLVTLANKGLVHISADNVGGKITLDLKEVTNNGKKQIYASKVNTVFDIEMFNYEFDDSEKNLIQLHEVIRNTISENKRDIINKVQPKLEELVSKKIILAFNNVTYNRFEQLFPDETP